ncbi:MAG TPA: tetratricopeptide repeat protein [Terriglobales bacterium]|nr:tetratricopeptide repeat protein [Terriglobales bacterium]
MRTWLLRMALLACLLSYGTRHLCSQAISPSAEPFDKLVARAQSAMESDHVAEAIRLYTRATALQPEWPEGWWHLGTLFYDSKQFLQARNSFMHFVAVERNQPGPGFAMLGLSEFQLKEYPKALASLERGIRLGLGDNRDFGRTVLYHDAILDSLLGRPEFSITRLTLLANRIAAAHPNSPKEAVLADTELLDAFGIAGLRTPTLPSEISPHKAPLVREVGIAQALIALQDRVGAGEQFKRVLALYPSEPGVHYAYGVFLLKDNPTLAVAEFNREIQISPSHSAARIQLALEFQRTAEYQRGLKYAKEAVTLAPNNFVAHVAYGRLLLALGKTQLAEQELRTAVKLAPGSPDAHFALSRALAEAGKNAEADRERAEFERLNASNLNASPDAAPH